MGVLDEPVFRGIAATTIDALLTIDERGTLTSFNPAAERLFGYAADEVLGRNVRMLMPDPYRSAHDGYLHAYRTTGTRQIIGKGRRVVAKRKDGQHVPIHLSVSEARVGDERVFVGIARDISELVEALSERDQSRRRADSILASAVDAILTIDGKGIVQDFNPAAERMFGYASADVVGTNVSRLMPRDHADGHDGYLARHLATGHVGIIGTGRLVQAKRADGSCFPAHLSVSRYEADGEPFFTGILRDMSNEVAQREALEAANQRLAEQNALKAEELTLRTLGATHGVGEGLRRALLDHLVERTGAATGVLYVARPQGVLEPVAGYAYPAERFDRVRLGQGLVGQVARTGGILRREVAGDAWLETSFGRLALRGILAVSLQDGEHLVGAVELGFAHMPDEPTVERLALLAPVVTSILTAGDQRVRIRELLEDSQRQAEELRVANEELSLRSEELEAQQAELAGSNQELLAQRRTLQAHQVELEQTNTELEASRQELERRAEALETTGRYKSEFLANMSHELRTPLNAILVLSRLLADDAESDDSSRESAEMIHRSGTDLLQLIDDILDISSIEAGKMRFRLAEVRIDDVLANLERVFAPLMDAAVDLRMVREPGVPDTLRTDETRLLQILRNLVGNAVKFTAAGHVELRVRNEAESLSFRVEDTGIGIPEEEQQAVFEAFHQVDGSARRAHGGTGLGLAISTRMADRLGGRITLASTVGVGTVFTLSLPIGKVAPGMPEVDRTEARPHGIEDDRLQPRGPDDKVLLVIEDDPELCRALVRHGRRLGLSVLASEDGEAGLLDASLFRPDAVLIDLRLPGIAGDEVLRRLRADPTHADVVFHLMSGEGPPPELAQGAATFHQKPIDPGLLASIAGVSEQRGEGAPILLVEDDPVFAASVEKALTHQGASVLQASDASSAIHTCERRRLSCIVVDLDLGASSGRELLRWRHTHERTRRTPVIILTGTALESSEVEALEEMAGAVILKGDRAIERLLDEATLFLHGLVARDDARPVHRDAALKGCRVLVVDDDMRNVFAVRKLLKTQGIEVVIARNGQEGLERVRTEGPFDAVLMDVMMPVMDGLEATRRLRELEEGDRLPILMLTAKATSGDAQRCLEAGASDYLAKPVDNDALLGLLRVWLRP